MKEDPQPSPAATNGGNAQSPLEGLEAWFLAQGGVLNKVRYRTR